jgi:photosynthetic reaction center cytochrome c subunit
MSKTRSELRDEMTGLLLRGGLIGLVVAFAAILFMVVPSLVARIWPTEFEQTGYRGTGMEVIRFQSEAVALAELNALPETLEAPIPPEPGEPLAGEIYENVQVLGHLTDANFNRLMLAITEWVSPEQGCAYCHGEEGNFASDDYYPKVVARNMIQMTWAINQDWDVHVAQTGVTCWTCHRGQNVPLNVWYSPVPLNGWAGPSARYQNQATAMNYSTALPVDAMQTYLLEVEQPVGVHGVTPRNLGVPGASIYHTYQTFSLMQHFSNALGVNCTYCHNTRALAEIDQATPQWATAQVGRAMVQEINAAHILPTQPLLPQTRLGPLGDVAKVNCTTCHQGAPKPLLGGSMLPDWPELASPEPVYQ